MIYHVHLDDQPTVALHVCEFHRTMALSLSCPDARPDGDCAHVQHSACTCNQPAGCMICEDV